MQELLMHISKIGGLKVLKPFTFENGKNMLCATDSLAFALFMYAKVDKEKHPEGNFHCNLRNDGNLYVDEKWENAVKCVFSGKKAFLYFIKKEGAFFNPAVPQYEFYKDMPIVDVKEINDIYDEIQKLVYKNKIKINKYKKQ